jgi:hypothetical protein
LGLALIIAIAMIIAFAVVKWKIRGQNVDNEISDVLLRHGSSGAGEPFPSA